MTSNIYLAYTLTLVLVIIKLSLTTSLTITTKFGFSSDLIQRDSPFSPTYDPKTASGAHDRLHRSFRRSLDRAKITAIRSSSSSSSSLDSIASRVVPSHGEYLMNVSIGTPPVPLLGVADTGSDLIWTQCRPCRQCFKQTPRMFDPAQSSSYQAVPCDANACAELPQSTCQPSSSSRDEDECGYSYAYGDQSYTRGNLASETIKVGSAALSRTVFGCGHQNGGTFDESGNGLIGLGGGPLSLVSQLGKTGNGKFSYCLVPLSAESLVTSKIVFGDGAEVSGDGTVSTPLVAKTPATFYYLTLAAVSVGEKRIVYDPDSSPSSSLRAAAEGNIIIDSGTTLTFLPAGFHDEIVSALTEAVRGAERVSDPGGVMSLCFRDSGAGEFDPPPVTAHFAGGADVVLRPLNTFARIEDDVVCLTMVPSSDVAIFGNLAQMNFLVGYDTEAGTVSFKPADCTTATI